MYVYYKKDLSEVSEDHHFIKKITLGQVISY